MTGVCDIVEFNFRLTESLSYIFLEAKLHLGILSLLCYKFRFKSNLTSTAERAGAYLLCLTRAVTACCY